MRQRFKAVAMALGWTVFVSGLAWAHHSVAANFDQSKTMEIVGKVKEIAIRDPHSQITLEVPKSGGGVTEFFIEWSDKNALMRRSVPVSLLKVGDTVTVSVMPSRRLPNLGYFRTATLPDGTILRDCGFAAFREGIASGKTGCEENTQ
jgi:hypothetical protein